MLNETFSVIFKDRVEYRIRKILELLAQCVRSCFGQKNAPILLPAHLKFSGCETSPVLYSSSGSSLIFFCESVIRQGDQCFAKMRCILTHISEDHKMTKGLNHNLYFFNIGDKGDPRRLSFEATTAPRAIIQSQYSRSVQ